MRKFAKKRYAMYEDDYLQDNYKKCTNQQMGDYLGRSEASITQRLHMIRVKGKIGYKLTQTEGNLNQFVGNSTELKLLNQGQRNKIAITQSKSTIEVGQYLKIMVGEKIENCLVEFVTDNYFSVKRKNYRDSFKFTELMQGTVTILV